jgi:hypothetical protein
LHNANSTKYNIRNDGCSCSDFGYCGASDLFSSQRNVSEVNTEQATDVVGYGQKLVNLNYPDVDIECYDLDEVEEDNGVFYCTIKIIK